MKEVYVVGEDPVTKEIVSRIIRDYAPNLYIKGYLPARGGEIKKKMENFRRRGNSPWITPALLTKYLSTMFRIS